MNAQDTTAARDVIAERLRQISERNYTSDWDDKIKNGSLAKAAASYANHSTRTDDARAIHAPGMPPTDWPWNPSSFKPTNRRRDLVKAGALILAEIERLDRAGA
ncbi:hypothetical protein H4S14_000773 [Agrobacterium vitis]|nr:hypothetical protein [Agrobacterium vitis]MBE1437046.1 hypothetical protein [Agrobacterium vitis]